MKKNFLKLAIAAASALFMTMAVVTPASAATNQQIIQDTYQDLLGRSADSSGLSYWTNQLNTQGCSPVSYSNVIKAMTQGGEFVQRIETDANAPFVTEGMALTQRMYQTALNRSANMNEVAYWGSNYNNWLTSHGQTFAINGVVNSILVSPEFATVTTSRCN